MAESLVHSEWVCKYRIHTIVQEKNRLLGDTRGYQRPVQVERCSNSVRKENARPHISITVVDTTKILSVKLYGISKREKCNDDL